MHSMQMSVSSLRDQYLLVIIQEIKAQGLAIQAGMQKTCQYAGGIWQNVYCYITTSYVYTKWYENTTLVLQKSRVKRS